MSDEYVTHYELETTIDKYDEKIRKHIDYSILGVKADFIEYVNKIVRINREDFNEDNKTLNDKECVNKALELA